MRCALILLAGCAFGGGDDTSVADGEVKIPSAIESGELGLRLDRPTIRGLQPWLSDAQFAVKWQTMLASPLDFLGSASSAYHVDLGTLGKSRLPGDEVLCHGDPKIDNFGWTLVEGEAVFADNDFDDAGPCPVASDALRYLLATDLAFDDAELGEAALQAYVDTVEDKHDDTEIDDSTEPDWSDVRSKGLAKAASGDALILGGEVQAATAAERTAVRALIAADARFAAAALDIARDVRTTGGSAGFRRFWVLTHDAAGARTVLELKELGVPATELGRHHDTLDGPDRFDALKAYWWDAAAETDHFEVALLGARFLVRDRFLRKNPDPEKLSHGQLVNVVKAEASLLAKAHRGAWHDVKRKKLEAYLRDSAAVLADKWRDAYRDAQ